MKPVPVLLLALAGGVLLNASCSSSDSPTANAGTGPAGGPVSGAADSHCDSQPIGVSDPAACLTTVTDAAAGAGGAAPDSGGAMASGGAADCAQTRDAAYGATLYNAEGDDDDCKYHASWSSTPIRLNEDVTFTVSATSRDAAMAPLAPLADGHLPLSSVEVYQPCSPTRRAPAQDYAAKVTATTPGSFTAGPIKFDQAGRWVVRFHFYEQCYDQETSPHGHIAFFVDVP